MAEIAYFVPGHEPPRADRPSPLQIYLPTMPAGVAGAYIEAVTRPGDLVLDPFCQTPQVIREGLALGRRVLAVNFNPVAVRAVEASLTWENWPDRRAASAALTRLADSLHGNETLRARLAVHYAARCPTCKKPALAEAFVWERDQIEPVEKCVRCAQCNAASRGPVDQDDLALARRYEPRSLPYWLLLDRVAASGAEHTEERERAAAVLAIYTPRALAAIADILIRFDALPEDARQALAWPLLETLAVSSSIHPDSQADERARAARPRSLKPPPRFVERNVWCVLQEALDRAMAQSSQAALPRAANLETFLAQRAPGAHLAARSNRDLAKVIEPGSVALAIGAPPEPDPTFWALCAVWSAWVWGARAGEILHPLLGRRRADMEWLWRGLAQALTAVTAMLGDTGRLALVHPSADDEWLGGLALAGARAGLELEHALAEPQSGLRLMWKRRGAQPARLLDAEAFGLEVMEASERAALDVMRARGEPTAWIHLAAGIYTELARTDLAAIAAGMAEVNPPPLALLTHLVRGAFEGRETALRRVEGSQQLWWTNRSLARMGLPLSDLVEMAVYDALQQKDAWDETEIVRNIYSRFHGALTPERALVAISLESYAQRARPGVCALRDEDQPNARHNEIHSLRRELAALGNKLGWQVDGYENRLVWIERRNPVYTFVFSATAQLSPHLLAKRPPRGVPVLVIPGGRAGLIQYKLRRNIQFREAVLGAGWQFLKFRHLRTLAADASLQRSGFQNALGLDPLIEAERQIALL